MGHSYYRGGNMLKGRIRESKGIKPFIFEESKLKKNLEMTLDFDADIKKGFNIIVLSHQPGIGKTYNVLEYMKKQPNSFYLQIDIEQ